ncbi:MAG: hypothetical protein ABI881_14390 [Betaproteobacteria bacterium]
MSRPVLFLLGMHAGGTSALATSLAQAGATLGATTTPTIDEDGGSTRCARLTALSDEALRCIGITWDSPVALPDRWESNDALKALAPAAAEAVAEEYRDGDAVVVADPRMCRLLPFWREAFEQNGFAPSVALTLRRPHEVATALAKRAQFAPEKSLALWHHHVVDGERGSRGLRRALVTFEQWQSDPAATLQRIARDAHFPLASTAARDAAQKARPRVKNGHDERSAGGMQSGLDTVLEAGYARLARLAPGVDPRRDVEALASAARPAMTAAIAPWLAAELDAARESTVRIATELALTQSRLQAATGELNALRAHAAPPPDASMLVAQLEALREDRARERALLIDELTKTRGEIVRMTTAVAEAPRNAEAMRIELAQAHRDLYDERATISRLADEIESTRRDADGNAKRFDSARHHLEALATELAQTRETAQAREHDYAVIADEIDAWRAQASDIQAERDKLLKDRDHAMREVSRLSTELDALRHERDGAIADRESLNEAMRQSGQALSVLRDELPRRAAAETMVARERDGLLIALKSAQERITALESMVGERSSYIAELVQRHNALAGRLNDLDKRSLVRVAVRLGGKSKPR